MCPNDVDVPAVVGEIRNNEDTSEGFYKLMRFLQGKRFKSIKWVSSVLSKEKNFGGFIRLFNHNRGLPVPGKARICYNDVIREDSIGIFTGCMSSIFFSDIINRVSDFYHRQGFNVYIPQGQVCCGLMNYSAGDRKKAIELAKINVELFLSNNIRRIFTPCSSCLHMLKNYANLIDDAEGLSDKIYTLDDFLFERIESTGFIPNSALHIPCHIKNSTDKSLYSRLKHLKNIKIIDECCGYGGVFNLYKYSKSLKIGERLLDRFKDISILYTLCSGCFLQFYDIFSKHRLDIRVRSIFELV